MKSSYCAFLLVMESKYYNINYIYQQQKLWQCNLFMSCNHIMFVKRNELEGMSFVYRKINMCVIYKTLIVLGESE